MKRAIPVNWVLIAIIAIIGSVPLFTTYLPGLLDMTLFFTFIG